MYKLFVDFVNFYVHFFALLTDALYNAKALYKIISQRWQPRWLSCIVTFTREQTAYDSFSWIILLLIQLFDLYSKIRNSFVRQSLNLSFISKNIWSVLETQDTIVCFKPFTVNQLLHNYFQLFWLMHVKKRERYEMHTKHTKHKNQA